MTTALFEEDHPRVSNLSSKYCLGVRLWLRLRETVRFWLKEFAIIDLFFWHSSNSLEFCINKVFKYMDTCVIVLLYCNCVYNLFVRSSVSLGPWVSLCTNWVFFLFYCSQIPLCTAVPGGHSCESGHPSLAGLGRMQWWRIFLYFQAFPSSAKLINSLT